MALPLYRERRHGPLAALEAAPAQFIQVSSALKIKSFVINIISRGFSA